MSMTMRRNSVYDSIEFGSKTNTVYRWNEQQPVLKGKYKNEYAGEVKTYKLSKEEMEEYLKKFNK